MNGTTGLAVLSERFPILGMALNHHKSTRGEAMSFRDKPYLIELYTGGYPEDGFDSTKCTQIGLSEYLIQMALHQAGFEGRIVAYVLPTFQLRDRFVQRRIDTLLTQIPLYSSLLPPDGSGSTKHKRFGKGSLLFLGANTQNDFVEFSADTIIVDEFDHCDASNIAMAGNRLRASKRPQIYRIGNPKLPKEGIAQLFEDTDQRIWHHRCQRCGERQPLDWRLNVVQQDAAGRWILRDKERREAGIVRPVCRKCFRPFDRVSDGGLWVSKYPSRPRRGYHATRMDVLSEDLRSLYVEWVKAQSSTVRMSAFYEGVLGLVHVADGSAVTADLLTRAANGEPMDQGGDADLAKHAVVGGCDVAASSLNVDICRVDYRAEDGKPIRVGRWTGEVRNFDELYDLVIRYNVRCMVVDARPETREAQRFRDRCTDSGVCDVWLCQFHRTDRIGAQDYGMTQNWDRKLVTVDRTQLLDATLDDIRVDPARRSWPEDIWTVKGWQEQMEAPKRVLNEDGGRFIWTEGRAEDHYRFSDAYSRVAVDLLSMQGEYIG